MKSVHMIVFVLGIGLFTLTADGQTQEKKPAARAIDPATIAAYVHLGADYMAWPVIRGGMFFANERLPKFGFNEHPKTRLPDASVPFGLDFHHDSMTDAGLKHLAGLKNLSSLDLIATNVTDAEDEDEHVHGFHRISPEKEGTPRRYHIFHRLRKLRGRKGGEGRELRKGGGRPTAKRCGIIKTWHTCMR